MAEQDWRGLGHRHAPVTHHVRDEDDDPIPRKAPKLADLERDKGDQADLDTWWAFTAKKGRCA